jgi:hypothetical protein
MSDDNNKINVAFLDGLNLSDEAKKKIREVANSRDLRVLVFDRLVTIFSISPKSTEEAASKYYKAEGLMTLLTIN